MLERWGRNGLRRAGVLAAARCECSTTSADSSCVGAIFPAEHLQDTIVSLLCLGSGDDAPRDSVGRQSPGGPCCWNRTTRSAFSRGFSPVWGHELFSLNPWRWLRAHAAQGGGACAHWLLDRECRSPGRLECRQQRSGAGRVVSSSSIAMASSVSKNLSLPRHRRYAMVLMALGADRNASSHEGHPRRTRPALLLRHAEQDGGLGRVRTPRHHHDILTAFSVGGGRRERGPHGGGGGTPGMLDPIVLTSRWGGPASWSALFQCRLRGGGGGGMGGGGVRQHDGAEGGGVGSCHSFHRADPGPSRLCWRGAGGSTTLTAPGRGGVPCRHCRRLTTTCASRLCIGGPWLKSVQQTRRRGRWWANRAGVL